MKQLKQIYKELLKEQPVMTGMPAAPPTGMEPKPAGMPAQIAQPQTSQEKIINYPNDSFSVNLFSNKKEIIFSPLKGSVPPKKPRLLVNEIQNKFNVKSVDELDGGVLKVVLNPNENFNSVVDFIKQFMEEKKRTIN